MLALGVGATIVHLHTQSQASLLASTQQLAANPDRASLPSALLQLPDPTPTSTPAPSNPPATAEPKSAPTTAAPAKSPSRPAPPRQLSVTAQQVLINRDRARYGLAPLAWNSCLYNVALANARRMASAEVMSHANGVYQDLGCHIGNRSGENVGYYTLGANDSIINNAFMNSPEHKANILGPYHYVATAWAIGANGYGYIAVEFD